MAFLDVIDMCDKQVVQISYEMSADTDQAAFHDVTLRRLGPGRMQCMGSGDFYCREIILAPDITKDDVVGSSATAITKLLQAAQDANSFPKLHNWPGEKFPVLGAPFPFSVDRAIAPYFGVASTGSQLNVFIRGDGGSVTGIWIAKRAANKPMYPGMLDNAVGGAVMDGETPRESLLREAMEEVGLDATEATSGGVISWFNIKNGKTGTGPRVVDPGVQYVYDLEIDPETVLHAAEAGIDWLRLLSVDEVMGALRRLEFKPSCACVMIDFFVRHSIITAENDRDFVDIVSRLHRKLPVPTTFPSPRSE